MPPPQLVSPYGNFSTKARRSVSRPVYPALQACRRRSQIVIELLTALSLPSSSSGREQVIERIRAGLHRVTEGCLQRYELPDEAERPWSPSGCRTVAPMAARIRPGPSVFSALAFALFSTQAYVRT
jgi:hypothetical protein